MITDNWEKVVAILGEIDRRKWNETYFEIRGRILFIAQKKHMYNIKIHGRCMSR